MPVAPAAAPALAKDERLAAAHILDDFPRFCILYDSPLRNGNYKIRSVCAVKFGFHPVAAVCRNVFLPVAKVKQCILALFDYKNNVPSVAAVTAVGAAVRNVFFPVKRDTAVAAVAGFDIYLHVIIKICHMFILSAVQSPSIARNSSSFIILTPSD